MNKKWIILSVCLLLTGLQGFNQALASNQETGPLNYQILRQQQAQSPNEIRMATDLVLTRPFFAGVTVIGTAVFLVGLPFSLIGGNVKESANYLVRKPAHNVFGRCLGCIS